MKRPLGISLLSLFFVFGTLMSGLTAFLLAFPGSRLDFVWDANPRARLALGGLGTLAVVLMSAVCLACATASLGLWRMRRWGLWTAAAVLSVNLVGDALNAGLAHNDPALIGLPIGGALLFYLWRQRRLFAA